MMSLVSLGALTLKKWADELVVAEEADSFVASHESAMDFCEHPSVSPRLASCNVF